MKSIEWDPKKNLRLQSERNISFEAIVVAIEDGGLMDIIPNPSKNYPNQQALVVDIDGYLCLVPFTEDANKIFLIQQPVDSNCIALF